ncbi:hypothetical protein KNE206_04630 [Kitasatospora sp. NE20-6]
MRFLRVSAGAVPLPPPAAWSSGTPPPFVSPPRRCGRPGRRSEGTADAASTESDFTTA